MIQELSTRGSGRLGRSITSAAASIPGHTAIAHWIHPVDRLLHEAFNANDIEYLQIFDCSYQGDPVVGPENSILAGHKLGLCDPHKSGNSCVRDDSPPYERYFLVGYYSNEIEVTATGDTMGPYVVHTYPFVDYNLRAEARYRNPDELYYWEAVRQFLSMPLAEFRRIPTKIIMYGDRSGEPRLRQIVMEVLEKFLREEQMPEWVDNGMDPVFVGALGAAEFALRKPYWVFANEKDVEVLPSELQVPLRYGKAHEGLWN